MIIACHSSCVAASVLLWSAQPRREVDSHGLGAAADLGEQLAAALGSVERGLREGRGARRQEGRQRQR